MSNIQGLFEQAQLAEAAYANFSIAGVSTKDALQDTENGGSFSATQAAEFVLHWRVVDQLPDTSNNGFSATVFESLDHPGEFSLAIRGSTPDQFGVDFLADTKLITTDGVAVTQLVNLYNYWQSLTHTGPYQAVYLVTQQTASLLLGALYLGDLGNLAQEAIEYATGLSIPIGGYDAARAYFVEHGFVVEGGKVYTVEKATSTSIFFSNNPLHTGNGKLIGEAVDVSGHSLGGHLAMAFSRLFPGLTNEVTAVNGLGFKPGDGNVNNLFAELGGLANFPSGTIQNIYGIAGFEFAAMNNSVLKQPGGWNGIYIESAGLETKGGHSATQMTDSLAVYDLFIRLDSGLAAKPVADALAQLRTIFEAGSNQANQTLESLVAALSQTLFGSKPVLATDDRESLYAAIKNVTDNINALSLAGQFTLTAPPTTAAEARSGFGAFLSLVNLTPFALHAKDAVAANTQYQLHAAIADLWNNDRNLTAEQHAQGQANFSDKWLEDRAAMLSWVNERNRTDTESPAGPSALFIDYATNTTLNVGGGTGFELDKRRFLFDGAGSNSRSGGSNSDRLYGMAGDDTLFGLDGNDWLEGGAGRDALYGDAGNDVLIGGTGNDTLNGGAGNDTLNGGLGFDSYIYKTGDGEDTLVEAREADGKMHGRVIIDGRSADLSQQTARAVGGILLKQNSPGNIWKTADGKITLTHNSPWRMVTDNGDTLWLGDYQDGDYGIRLLDNADTAVNTDTAISGDLAPIDQNTQADGIQLGYDARGNVLTDPDLPEPGRDDTLYGSGGNDLIRGLGGNDRLIDTQGGQDHLEGGEGDDILEAGTGDDLLINGAGADIAFADAGDDTLFAANRQGLADAFSALEQQQASGLKGDWLDGGAGRDNLVGDAGHDALYGGADDDILLGGGGDDVLSGDAQADAIRQDWVIERQVITRPDGSMTYDREYTQVAVSEAAEAGDDILYGQGGADWLFGGQGKDYLDGGADDDVVFGEEGHDILYGGDGNDMLNGDNGGLPEAAQGDDWLDGGAGDDTLIGLGGNDTLQGGDGVDQLDGGAGNDILRGDAGMDTLIGNLGDDELSGGDDADTLYGDLNDGRGGNDVLDGGRGNDTLFGGLGEDRLSGGEGNDILAGDEGAENPDGGDADILEGGAGVDALFGQGGNDRLAGGRDGDELQGGAGDDTYVFNTGDGQDTLVDDSGNNVIEFGTGISKESISASYDRMTGHLAIYFGAGTDSVTIANGFSGGTISRYRFADGSTMTHTELMAAALQSVVYSGSQEADIVSGSNSRDNLWGNGGDDVLYGNGGSDILIAGAGDDWLSGGTGNDFLEGSSGDDTYHFARGDGQDALTEEIYGGTDTIAFGPGIRQSDLRFVRRDNADLVIEVANAAPSQPATDSLTLAGWFDNRRVIERITFADGSEMTDLADLPIAAIEGTAGDDIMTGTLYDDTLAGGEGHDTYLLTLGQGKDTVREAADQSSTVLLDAAVRLNDVGAYRRGDDLAIVLDNGSDSLTVKDYFVNRQSVAVKDATGNEIEAAGLVARTEAESASNGAVIDNLMSGWWTNAWQSVANYYSSAGYRFSEPGVLTRKDTSLTASYSRTNQVSKITTFNLQTKTESSRTETQEFFRFTPSIDSLVEGRVQIATQTITDDGILQEIQDGKLGSSSQTSRVKVALQWTGSGGYYTDSVWSGGSISPPITSQTVTRSVSWFGSAIGQIKSMEPTVLPITNTFYNLPEQMIFNYLTLQENYLFKRVTGGDSANEIHGGTMVDGGAGDDVLVARPLSETGALLFGNAGNDTLLNGALMIGGAGNDTLQGGDGQNRFFYTRSGNGNDVVLDTGNDNNNGQYFDWYFAQKPDMHWNWREMSENGHYCFESFIFETMEEAVATFAFYRWDNLQEMIARGSFYHVPGRSELPVPNAHDYEANAAFFDSSRAANDTIEFAEGVRPEDLQLSWSALEGKVALTVTWDGGVITTPIPRSTDQIGTGIERFRFADGTVLGMGQMINRAPPHPDFDAEVTAIPANAGLMVFSEAPEFLMLDPAIPPADISVHRNGSDLVFRAGGTSVIMSGWYADTDSQTTRVYLPDGSVRDAAMLTEQGLTQTEGSSEDDQMIGFEGFRNGLYGYGGNDTLIGADRDDTLAGGSGNDILDGAGGDDTYIFKLGDGVDTIHDIASPGEGNTLLFGDGIAQTDITLGLGSLLIRVGNGGDALHLEQFNPDDALGARAIETFRFADGTELSYAGLLARGFDITGTADSDTLSGTSVNDRIRGLGGNDTLSGGAGSDRYIFAVGDGRDSVQESAVDTVSVDVLQMQMAASAITGVAREDQALVIRYGSADQVRIENWFNAAVRPVEGVEFSDGTVWDAATLEQKTITNRAPTVAAPIAGQSALEDNAFVFSVPSTVFADPDAGDTLSYAATLADGSDLPGWLTFDAASATFTGTPGNGDVGPLQLTVKATDKAGASAQTGFTLSVSNLNDAPTGGVSVTGTASENQTLVAASTLADDDGLGEIAYQWQMSSDGMTWHAITGASAGDFTPGEAQVGRRLRVVASYTDARGTPEQVASAPTAAVAPADKHIIGGAGNDTLIGGAGNDLLNGGSGVDMLNGGAGKDTLMFSFDKVWSPGFVARNDGSPGFAGSLETVGISGKGNSFDLFIGGEGFDILQGTAGSDAIFLDDRFSPLPGKMGARIDGIEMIAAGDGDDVVDLTSALYGYGNVTLDGGNGNDVLWAGAGNDILIGGRGSDNLSGGAGNDVFLIDGNDSVADRFAGDAGDDLIQGGSGDDVIRVSNFSGRNTVERIDGGAGSNSIAGTQLNDTINLSSTRLSNIGLIDGAAGHDVITGSAGNDIILGGAGNDLLSAGAGNNLLDGSAGNDTLTGGAGNEFLAGGTGQDTIATGAGFNVIAFNKGDGQDMVNPAIGAANTISLGGGIRYTDLTFSKSGNNLILGTGGADQVTFRDWYGSGNNRTVFNLQVIAEAMADFAPDGADPLRDDKIETFEFSGLVSAFDAARGNAVTFNPWALTHALLDFHLGSGSDADAIGGDLAYQYGRAGTLAGIGANAAQGVIGDTAFGCSPQILNAATSWQGETLKLG